MKLKIETASNVELNDKYYLFRLWLAARNMPYSRREWPNIICKAIYEFDGEIVFSDGWRWPIPDIDEVLGDPRWFSYYFEECNGKPKRTVRLLERLRILDLWFRIAKPDIQAHFSK